MTIGSSLTNNYWPTLWSVQDVVHFTCRYWCNVSSFRYNYVTLFDRDKYKYINGIFVSLSLSLCKVYKPKKCTFVREKISETRKAEISSFSHRMSLFLIRHAFIILFTTFEKKNELLKKITRCCHKDSNSPKYDHETFSGTVTYKIVAQSNKKRNRCQTSS